MSKRLPITDPKFDLRYLIKSAGISQTALAKELGVTVNAVQKWCAGDHKPRLDSDQIDKILKKLHCNSTELKVAAQNSCTAKELKVAAQNSCTAKLSVFKEKKLEKIVA